MSRTTPYQGKYIPDTTSTSADNDRHRRTRQVAARTLWVLGLFALIAASFTVHFHPGPWPFDLQTTITVQHTHLVPIMVAWLNLVSFVNDPIASTIALIAWLVIFSLIGIIQKVRKRYAAGWFVTGLFISLGTAALDGIDGLISLIVARPRPGSPLIHVYQPEPFHSFPSGHVENDLVYYGFLLYLSLSKPVRRWRYRWVLIPFQVFAVLVIATIGYSRIYEGSHWLTDVLGGYLSGAILLGFLIFLYRRVMQKIYERRAKKSAKSLWPRRTAG